jgi:hypothetical protein
MAINPNTDFTTGAVLTAAQQNRFPRGVMATASSSTSYTVTTSVAIATGMTVTFTAVANRNYRVTYYEPQVQSPSTSGSFVSLNIRLTNAAGTQLQSALCQTNTSGIINETVTTIYVGTFTAGSVTLVGCAVATVTTGTPVLTRAATTLAHIIVEDIGTA